MIFWTTRREATPSVPVTFGCRNCGASRQGTAFRRKTSVRLYGLLPVYLSDRTELDCASCHSRFRSREAPSVFQAPRIVNASTDDALVSPEPTTLGKALAVAGVLTLPAAFAGIPINLAAYGVNRKCDGWAKRVPMGILAFQIALCIAYFAFVVGKR